MATPFFSVIIPTRNRGFLVGDAVESVLRQNCGDFEIIVVDNDDSDETAKAMGEFTDGRIRSVRTGRLSMPDNWERGCDLAEGRYLLILEDKAALKTHALARIKGLLEANPCEVACWLHDLINDTLPEPLVVCAPATGKASVLSPEEVLNTLLNEGREVYKRVVPRAITACIGTELAERIRRSPAGRLCLPTSPDYSMAFLCLAFADRILAIDEALVVIGGLRHSHGNQFLRKGELAKQYMKDLGMEDDALYRMVPVKANLLSGVIYNDYAVIRDLVGGRLEAFPLNTANYFVECWKDIQASKAMGVDYSDEERAWSEALALQPPNLRQEIEAAVATAGGDGPSALRGAVKNFLRAVGLEVPAKKIRDRLRGEGDEEGGGAPPSFEKPLDYIAWEDRRREAEEAARG